MTPLIVVSAVLLATAVGLLATLAIRRLVLARSERRSAAAERRVRPIAIELIEGVAEPPALPASDQTALARVVGRYSRKVAGETSARIAAPQLVPMGILAVVNVVTFAVAVERMSPALVALIFYIYPILVIAGSHFIGWSRFNALTGLAAGATFLGVGLTIGLPQGEVDGVAVALSLLNGIGYAAYILLAERALRGADPVTSIALMAGVSSGLLLVGCLAIGVEIPSEAAGRAILAALFASMFAPHVLVLSGIGRLGGPWGSIVSCLEIVTTVVATALVLGLPLGPGVIAGGTLVILGGVAGPILAQQRGRLPATSSGSVAQEGSGG